MTDQKMFKADGPPMAKLILWAGAKYGAELSFGENVKYDANAIMKMLANAPVGSSKDVISGTDICIG